MEGLRGRGVSAIIEPNLCNSRYIPLNLAKGVINDIGYPGLFLFCRNFRHLCRGLVVFIWGVAGVVLSIPKLSHDLHDLICL